MQGVIQFCTDLKTVRWRAVPYISYISRGAARGLYYFVLLFIYLVPVCAATSFFKSPMVSSSLHFTRTFFPRRSLTVISSIINLLKSGVKKRIQKMALLGIEILQGNIIQQKIYFFGTKSDFNEASNDETQ